MESARARGIAASSSRTRPESRSLLLFALVAVGSIAVEIASALPCAAGPFGQADYNSDGGEEIGVFRNGIWYMAFSPDYFGVDLARAFGSPVGGRDSPEIGEFSCLAAGGGQPDGQTDFVVLRKLYSTWQVALSPDWSGVDLSVTFGTTAHKKISLRRLDTNGDGCSDIGLFRNGCFNVLESPNYGPSFKTWCFGLGTDEPLMADLDGDGMSDLILWRASKTRFWYRLSSEDYGTDHAGDLGAGNYPLIGDVNGDGRLDLGSYETIFSTFRFTYAPDFVGLDFQRSFGLMGGGTPMIAEMNGDGTDDIGYFRNSTAAWAFSCSPTWGTCVSMSFGMPGDQIIYGKPPGMP